MYTGIIVDNSLTEPSVLNSLNIIKTWQDGSWILHKVQVTEPQIKQISDNLAEGSWYTHFWNESESEIIVIFKNKVFTIDVKDHSTWQEAIMYGKSLGIPIEQLDFLINQDEFPNL
jgi:hypothetical protein